MKYEGLNQFNQFVVWRLTPNPNGKSKKQPININTISDSGYPPPCGATDSTAFVTLARAEQYIEAAGDPTLGVGFAFTDNDPFWFIDIDNCIIDGQWSPIAIDLMSRAPLCFTELSVSGKGLHIIGTGDVPYTRGRVNHKIGLEVYTKGRFVALTGNMLPDGTRTNALATPSPGFFEHIVSTYLPLKNDTGIDLDTPLTSEPVPEWDGITDDTQLIGKMLRERANIRQVMGDKSSTIDLWQANEDALSQTHPILGGQNRHGYNYDHSAADADLITRINFYTGNNEERTYTIFKQSGLYRPSRDDGHYLHNTIKKMRSEKVYGAGDIKRAKPPEPAPETTEGEGGGKLWDTWVEGTVHFTDFDCYFNNPVLVVGSKTPTIFDGRAAYSMQTFNAMYSNMEYDNGVDEKPTRKAWDALVNSNCTTGGTFELPRVSSVIYDPSYDNGQLIIITGTGDRFPIDRTEWKKYPVNLIHVNSYQAPDIKKVEGDISPLTDLMIYHWGYEDTLQIINFMAAMVQYPGEKFQYMTLLHGPQGCGKSTILRMLANAMGANNSYFMPTVAVGEKFNSFIEHHAAIFVHEFKIGHDPDRILAFKELITERQVQVTYKGVDARQGFNCAKVMGATNSETDYKMDAGDRRMAIYLSLREYGEGDYLVDRLYDWLDNHNGQYIFNWFMYGYKVPDNALPWKIKAPITSTTGAAIDASLSPAAVEIRTAVENEELGFIGGMVSTSHVVTLLKKAGLKYGSKAISHYLTELGYHKQCRIRVDPQLLPIGRTHIWMKTRDRFYPQDIKTNFENTLRQNTNPFQPPTL